MPDLTDALPREGTSTGMKGVAILSWQLKCHTEIKVTVSNRSRFPDRERAAPRLFTYGKW